MPVCRFLKVGSIPQPRQWRVHNTYVVCGCCRAGTYNSQSKVITQIVQNWSSLFTLFYSVIYISVPFSLYSYLFYACTVHVHVLTILRQHVR